MMNRKNFEEELKYCYEQIDTLEVYDKYIAHLESQNKLNEIIKWQTDRNLDKMPYSHYDETLNRLEEVCESWGLSRAYAQYLLSRIYDESDARFITEYETIDSLFDECVYAIGAMLKLGYDPMKAFEEGLKEINERTGSYDARVGKWCKGEKKPNAYEADYSRCKLCNK